MTTAASPDLGPLAQLRAGRLPRRLLVLALGLTAYGATLALIIRAGLGNSPWDVLHQGVARHTPLSIGTVIIVVSVVVLLLWLPLRQVPGLGTVANALWVGVSADVTLALVPAPEHLVAQVPMLVVGVLGNAVATAVYIGAGLGPGTRDGLMTGLHRRTGVSVRLVRTGIEVSVVVIGVLLGGRFGIGTVLYAVAIGPLVQVLLPRLTVPLAALPGTRRPSTSSDVVGWETCAGSQSSTT